LLALDHVNREWALARLDPRSERELAGGDRLVEERRWDAWASRVIKQVTLRSGAGEVHTWHESVRLYEPEELEDMLSRAGLDPMGRYGDYDGSSWEANSPRLIVLARRIAE
jgi:hypothetical protein